MSELAKQFVWYVAYGSNILEERFMNYIKGGKFRLGGSYLPGCNDKKPPTAEKPSKINYELFFAKHSSSWGGGVAFISQCENKNKLTHVRMWKVTFQQFLEIKKQEGGWYNKQIDLGKDSDGITMMTFTNDQCLQFTKPSSDYLKTIMLGLREINLDDEQIIKYIIETAGVEKNFSVQDLRNILAI